VNGMVQRKQWQPLTILCLAILIAAAAASTNAGGADVHFLEDFDSGSWAGTWHHTSSSAHEGRFVTEAAPSWKDKGLKVRKGAQGWWLVVASSHCTQSTYSRDPC
jgi:hypothetical protein